MYQPLNKESLQTQVYNNLKQLIIEGQLKPGDYLPSERELCEKFQISRVPIREALKKLEGLGVISISHGGKTLINGLGILPLIEIFDYVKESNSDLLEDLTEARLFFEVGAARLAALRATKEEMSHMREICNQMLESLGEQEKVIDASLAFHLALSKASKNMTIANFMIMIVDLQRKSREVSMFSLEGQDLSVKDHFKILESIERGDPEEAAAEMSKHLIQRSPCRERLKALFPCEISQ